MFPTPEGNFDLEIPQWVDNGQFLSRPLVGGEGYDWMEAQIGVIFSTPASSDLIAVMNNVDTVTIGAGGSVSLRIKESYSFFLPPTEILIDPFHLAARVNNADWLHWRCGIDSTGKYMTFNLIFWSREIYVNSIAALPNNDVDGDKLLAGPVSIAPNDIVIDSGVARTVCTQNGTTFEEEKTYLGDDVQDDPDEVQQAREFDRFTFTGIHAN